MFNTSQLQEWQKQQRSPAPSRQTSNANAPTHSLFAQPDTRNTHTNAQTIPTQPGLFSSQAPYNAASTNTNINHQPMFGTHAMQQAPRSSSTSASLFPSSNSSQHNNTGINAQYNTPPSGGGGGMTQSTGPALFGPPPTSVSQKPGNTVPPPLFGSHAPNPSNAGTSNGTATGTTKTLTGGSLFGARPTSRTSTVGNTVGRLNSTDSSKSVNANTSIGTNASTRSSQAQSYVPTQPLYTQRQPSETSSSSGYIRRDTQTQPSDTNDKFTQNTAGAVDGSNMVAATGNTNKDISGDTSANTDSRVSASTGATTELPTIPSAPLERNDSTDSLDGLFRTPVPADIKPSTTTTIPARTDTLTQPPPPPHQQQLHQTASTMPMPAQTPISISNNPEGKASIDRLPSNQSVASAASRQGSVPTPRLGAPPVFGNPAFGAPPMFTAPSQPAQEVSAPIQASAGKAPSEPSGTQAASSSTPTTGVVFRGSFDFSQLQGDGGETDGQIQANIDAHSTKGDNYMHTGSRDSVTSTSAPLPPPPMFAPPPTQALAQTPRENISAATDTNTSTQQPPNTQPDLPVFAQTNTNSRPNTPADASGPGVPVFRGSFDFNAMQREDTAENTETLPSNDASAPPPINPGTVPSQTLANISSDTFAPPVAMTTDVQSQGTHPNASLANGSVETQYQPGSTATAAEQPQPGVPVFRGSFDFSNMQTDSHETRPDSTREGAARADSGSMAQNTSEVNRLGSVPSADGRLSAQSSMPSYSQQPTHASMGPPPMGPPPMFMAPQPSSQPTQPFQPFAPPPPLPQQQQDTTPLQQPQSTPMPNESTHAPHQTPEHQTQPGVPVFRGSFDFNAMQAEEAPVGEPESAPIQSSDGPYQGYESNPTQIPDSTQGIQQAQQQLQQQQQQQQQPDQQQPLQPQTSGSLAQAPVQDTPTPGVPVFRGSFDLNAMREEMDNGPAESDPRADNAPPSQPTTHTPPASAVGQPVFRGSFDFSQMQSDADAPAQQASVAAEPASEVQPPEQAQFYNPSTYTAPQQPPSAFNGMAPPDSAINNYQSDASYGQSVGISNVPIGKGSFDFNQMNGNVDSQTAFQPPAMHWFYKHYETRGWTAFSIIDNDALEKAHRESESAQMSGITGEIVVPVNGGRYDAFLTKRKMQAVYWMEDAMDIARCSWMKKHINGAMKPYPEDVGELLEREYTQAYRTDTWNRRIITPAGDLVVMFSPTVAVHYNKSEAAAMELNGQQADSAETPKEPFMAVRGFDSILFDAGEGPPEHLYLVIHGIGNKVDLKQRDLVQATRSMRTSSRRLRKNAQEEGGEPVPVAEYLPIMWHSSLHSNTGVDAKINAISLQSIKMLREFVNTTVLDVLYFTSPHYCQTIADTVAKELNRVYQLFTLRHPEFKGKVNIVGHSLGSIIAFDILAHQQVPGCEPIVETTPIAPAVPATVEPIPEEDSKTPKTERERQIQKAREKYHRMRERRGMPPSPALTPMPSLSALAPNGVSTALTANQTPGKAATDSSAIGIGQPQVSYRKLDFQPAALFALGSPIGMFLTVRGVEPLGPDFKLPTCGEFYNIFHPYDPVAFRIEPLLDNNMANVQPCEIHSHTGRKKLHVELKNLGTSILSTVKSSWTSWGNWGGAGQSQPPASEKPQLPGSDLNGAQIDNNKVAKEEPDPYYEGWTCAKAPAINKGQRVDYALQCGLLESMNEYMFAITSHLVYWENLDTAALLLKDARELKQQR